MRVLYFGTPTFAVPTLLRLLEGPHSVCGVVSQPDRRRGRGRKTSPSPVAEVALDRGLALFRPEKVGDPSVVAELGELDADIGVVAAFGQFLTRRVRELPARGYLINAHASLLPKYRGAAPIARAILDGEKETGISVMRIEREMDAGPVLHVERTPIGPDENTGELTERLADLAAESIARALSMIEAGADFTEQDHAAASHAPKIGKEDAELDFSESAELLARRVRAMAPAPGAVADSADGALRILAARVDASVCDASPGSVRVDPSQKETPIRIATSAGWLLPVRLQRAGGKQLAAGDFLRGRGLADGDCVGPVGSAARLSDVPGRA